MTPAAPTAAIGPRCADWAREEHVDPVGTAGTHHGYLLVEWPQPWPSDLSEVPELAPLHEALAGTGLRLQGLVPAAGHDRARRVVRWAPEPGADRFTGHVRAERAVAPARLVEAAIELASGAEGDPAPAAGSVTHDVLVCGHGRRDVCCGARGTALVAELSMGPVRLGGTHRVWRTSHTGGHRFAPTAIVLPDATAWAYLDADALGAVLHRTGEPAGLLDRYRGCSALASPAQQAVEREALRAVGWAWLDWARWGDDLGDGRARVSGRSPGGEVRTWTATVVERRRLPIPDCGRPLEDARKSEAELEVRDLVVATVTP